MEQCVSAPSVNHESGGGGRIDEPGPLVVFITLTLVAAWRSGNIIGCISEVTLCRAGLVLGWWPSSSDKPPQYFIKLPRPPQPSTVSGTGNEYQPKCSDTLQLGCKGRHDSLHLWMNVCVAGKTVWSLINMPSVPYLSALEMSHYKARYKSTDTLLYWWFDDRKDIRPIETCAT